MKFVSTRIITADVKRLVAFYEMVTGAAAVWGNELFAEIPTPVGTLAIGSDQTVPLFGAGSAEPAANRSAILEFLVEDVDADVVGPLEQGPCRVQPRGAGTDDGDAWLLRHGGILPVGPGRAKGHAGPASRAPYRPGGRTGEAPP